MSTVLQFLQRHGSRLGWWNIGLCAVAIAALLLWLVWIGREGPRPVAPPASVVVDTLPPDEGDAADTDPPPLEGDIIPPAEE